MRSSGQIQAELAECGLACIAMILSHYGNHGGLMMLRQRHSTSLKGGTLASLIRVCRSNGLNARPVRLELSELSALKLPCVLHWDILDEATSHLDVANERVVNEAVKAMKLTKVIIAHRPETIASADRVLIMESGRIVSSYCPGKVETAVIAA